MKESTSRLTTVSIIGLICSFAATTGRSEVLFGIEPDCSQWDVRGQWEFVQTNGTSPVFTLQQTETGLLGSAKYGFYKPVLCNVIDCNDDYYAVHASVDGTAKGSSFDIVAYWDNGTTGVYTGKIGPQGRIEGSTYDRQNPRTMASWYSNRTAECLGTSASPLTTAPAAQTVRAQGRVKLDGVAGKSTLTKCEAAKIARARNSPAAPGLEALCAKEKASGVSDVATAGNEARRVPPGESPVITKDEKFGAGGATRIVLLATVPENSIQVRVRYRNELGYKDTTNAFGSVGPTSCSAFSISVSEPDGSERRRHPLPISTDSRMADVSGYYICSYLISELPLDQSIGVTVRVASVDASAPWNGGDAAQPPTGERRTILDASRTATLNATMPRARLSYEMVYAPLPRIRDSR
jgi:hypothetical protein